MNKQNKKKPKSDKIPDRRAMEKSLADISKLLEGKEFNTAEEANAYLQNLLKSDAVLSPSKRTPLENAQDLMYNAWECSGKQRVKLARQALEISEGCADAYVLLAQETAQSLNEAKELYERGVKAGERALGPNVFIEDVGHFWGLVETRPYMRARLGLANCLWSLGERKQAIEQYYDMLRLNPGDNQGIRYILANCLFKEGLDDELEKLFSRYEDDSTAEWLYNRALWMFRHEGASLKANFCLNEALETNQLVPSYLLGKKQLPKQLPDCITIGGEDEAVGYAAIAIEIWGNTPGALEWLSGNLPYNITVKRINSQRVGRNDPCPCGSGEKYKKCCGR